MSTFIIILITINIMIELFKSFWKNYQQPTPIQYRKIGDSILVISSFLGLMLPLLFPTIPVVVSNSVIILGIVGKFLSNFKTAQTPKEILELINTIKGSMKEAEN